jgi:hypothetical protein
VLVEKATGRITTFQYIRDSVDNVARSILSGNTSVDEHTISITEAEMEPTLMFVITHDYRVFSHIYCSGTIRAPYQDFNKVRPRRILIRYRSDLDEADFSEIELDPNSNIDAIVTKSTMSHEGRIVFYVARAMFAPIQQPPQVVFSAYGANAAREMNENTEDMLEKYIVKHKPCKDESHNDTISNMFNILVQAVWIGLDIDHFIAAASQLPPTPRPLFARGIPNKLCDIDIFTD